MEPCHLCNNMYEWFKSWHDTSNTNMKDHMHLYDKQEVDIAHNIRRFSIWLEVKPSLSEKSINSSLTISKTKFSKGAHVK